MSARDYCDVHQRYDECLKPAAARATESARQPAPARDAASAPSVPDPIAALRECRTLIERDSSGKVQYVWVERDPAAAVVRAAAEQAARVAREEARAEIERLTRERDEAWQIVEVHGRDLANLRIEAARLKRHAESAEAQLAARHDAAWVRAAEACMDWGRKLWVNSPPPSIHSHHAEAIEAYNALRALDAAPPAAVAQDDAGKGEAVAMDYRDVRAALEALGLDWPSDARNPRDVFHAEVIPRIRVMRSDLILAEANLAAERICPSASRPAPDDAGTGDAGNALATAICAALDAGGHDSEVRTDAIMGAIDAYLDARYQRREGGK